MRTPIHRLKGKPRRREETPQDALADLLSKSYTIVREKAFGYTDPAGQKQTMLLDIAIPKHKLIVEIQQKQDTKGILGEIARDKVARANGWIICRLTETEARTEDSFWRIRRSIERGA